MGVILSGTDVLKQSRQVFAQFGELWKKNCEINAGLERGDMEQLRNSGVGKHLVLCATGPSLEGAADVIRKYRDRVDVVTNDKAFCPLLEHGVKADFVIICDASIPFRHIEAHVNDTAGVKLLSTAYANPEWTRAWKGPRYFFINEDAIESQRLFIPHFGPNPRVIPAGSNVSNAMLIFFTGSNMQQNVNWSGYEQFVLTGYDYSWRQDTNYYAWSNPTPKRHYMLHRTVVDYANHMTFTSENLLFSAKWMFSYITNFGLNVINCSGQGLLDIPKRGDLETVLAQINPDPAARALTIQLFNAAKKANEAFTDTVAKFNKSREALYVSRRLVSASN